MNASNEAFCGKCNRCCLAFRLDGPSIGTRVKVSQSHRDLWSLLIRFIDWLKMRTPFLTWKR
jgi:hypothetical protein